MIFKNIALNSLFVTMNENWVILKRAVEKQNEDGFKIKSRDAFWQTGFFDEWHHSLFGDDVIFPCLHYKQK